MSTYTRKTPVKNDCLMEISLNVISGKWKPAIISALLKGPQRPRDMQEGLPEATKRVLTQQLKELEQDGIIWRKVYEEVPPKVEYYLTDLGKSLLPVVEALNAWGRLYKDYALSQDSDQPDTL